MLDDADIDLESMAPEAVSAWVRKHPEQAWRKAYETAAYMIATGQVQLPQGNAPEPTPEPGDTRITNDEPNTDRNENDYFSIVPPPDFPFRNMRNHHGLSVANGIVNPDDTFKWDSTHIVFEDISGYNSYQDTKILRDEKIIDLQGVEVPATMVAAGISVQSWYLSPIWDKESWMTELKNAGDEGGSGFGPAQVSNEQMQLYGLDGLDQMDPEVAKQAMAVRIAAALKTCENLEPIDKLIIAGMAQNGSFFDYDLFKATRNPVYISDDPEIPGHLDWQEFFKDNFHPSQQKISNTFQARGKNYDTQYMVKLYLNDMLELHKQGMELPYGVSVEEIEDTITYMEGIKIIYAADQEK